MNNVDLDKLDNTVDSFEWCIKEFLEAEGYKVLDCGYKVIGKYTMPVVLEPFNVTKIFKGNRIAQLVILPLPQIKMIEGKVIGIDTHRGDGGFGSTGE